MTKKCTVRVKLKTDISTFIMKVFLAAQVLSASTAAALHYLEHEIKNTDFKDVSTTAKFCQIFNDIFDIFNSQNKFCKVSGRNGMTEKNLPKLKKKLMNMLSKTVIGHRVAALPLCRFAASCVPNPLWSTMGSSNSG